MDGQLPKLEHVCSFCENKVPLRYRCQRCGGVGYESTDAGDELLSFLIRRGFVQARERN